MYLFRYIDKQIEDTLKYAGAIWLQGPKFCGKTTSAQKSCKSITRVNTLETANVIKTDPSYALNGSKPHLIDEWQIVPDIWNHIKNDIDNNYEPGKYIITGSATPADPAKILHSGAGRITPLLLRPMSLFESGDSDGTVSIQNLFDRDKPTTNIQSTNLENIAYLICRGGWPLACTSKKNVASKITKDYFESLFNFSETSDGNYRNKKPHLLYSILKSYARNVSTEASNKTILNDVSALTGNTIAMNTLLDYVNALRDLYIIEDMPAWNPHIKSKTSIRTKATRHFVDPSIAAAALGLNPKLLMNDGEAFGLFFEDLAVRDLRIYAQALEGKVVHYRDNTGLECDSIIMLDDGRWAAIEIKLGGQKAENDGARSLKTLSAKMQNMHMPEPSFLMVLTAAETCYTRNDNVMVVPLTSLCV